MQLCNFLTQPAFYILFELCIFYLLLRSTAANVTCFNTLALSLSLSETHTETIWLVFILGYRRRRRRRVVVFVAVFCR